MFTKNSLAALSTPKAVGKPNSAVLEPSPSAIVPLPISIKSMSLVSEAFVKVVAGAGEGIVDIVIDTGNKIFRNNPVTPEIVQGSTLDRCTRWAVDATDTLGRIQTGNLSKTEQTQAALNLIYIAKNMKGEGCSRPSAISQAQWDQA